MNWISVKDKLPECLHECTSSFTEVSNTVLIADSGDMTAIGFGHINEHGVWTVYQGEYDFMNLEDVTHWMELPKYPRV